MPPDEPVVFYCPGIVGKTLCESRLLGKSKLSFQLGQEVEFKKICQAVCILGNTAVVCLTKGRCTLIILD